MSTFKSWSDCVTAWTQYMDFKEKKKKSISHSHSHDAEWLLSADIFQKSIYYLVCHMKAFCDL